MHRLCYRGDIFSSLLYSRNPSPTRMLTPSPRTVLPAEAVPYVDRIPTGAGHTGRFVRLISHLSDNSGIQLRLPVHPIPPPDSRVPSDFRSIRSVHSGAKSSQKRHEVSHRDGDGVAKRGSSWYCLVVNLLLIGQYSRIPLRDRSKCRELLTVF